MGLVLLFPLVFTHSNKIASGAIQLTILDVGQGLAAVVLTANHVLVYDSGARFSSTQDSEQSVLIPVLRHPGISTIDNLVASHGDNDHVGGVDHLLASMLTHQFLTRVPYQFGHYSAFQCNAGQSWLWDKVTFTILSPQPNLVFCAVSKSGGAKSDMNSCRLSQSIWPSACGCYSSLPNPEHSLVQFLSRWRTSGQL